MRQIVFAPCQSINCYKDTFVESISLARDRGGSPSSYEMLKMATVGGAQMMGRTDIGTLETGKGADLFMIDTEKLEYSGALHDPANLIARMGATGPVWLTMINGKVVYKDGILQGIDERKLAAEAEKVCTRVIRNNSSKYI